MLTVQRVSGALRSGGFKAGRYVTTSVRGWHEVSSGFKTAITWPNDGSVSVSWMLPTLATYDKKEESLKRLQQMRHFLTMQGFAVELDVDYPRLRVKLRL